MDQENFLKSNKTKKVLVDEVAKTFEEVCLQKLKSRLKSLYLVGSYTFNKISLDRPDINFLLILDKEVIAGDCLKIGEICRGWFNFAN